MRRAHVGPPVYRARMRGPRLPPGHDEQVSASLVYVLEGKTWSALPCL